MNQGRVSRFDIFGKKGDVAICQLCNTELVMSQAHVPPQSCIEPDRKKRTAAKYFSGEQVYELQNGVHFYTLCAACNNNFGNLYDNNLAQFSRYWRLAAKAPSIAGVYCKPNRVARSLIGSYLAAGGEYLDQRFKKMLQEYVLDEVKLLPDALKIGIWLHPFDSVIVKPDFVIMDTRQSISVRFMMKYYPLAWIIYSSPQENKGYNWHQNIDDFSIYLSGEIDEEKAVRIDRQKQKTEYWPDSTLIGKNAQEHAIYAPARINL